MDNYVEQIVKRKKAGSSELLQLVGSVVMTAIGIIFILCIDMRIGILLLAAGIFLIVYTKPRLNAEFEYVFTNGDVDVAVIYNMQTRKNYYSFDADKVIRVSKYTDESFLRSLENDSKLDVKYITSGDKANQDAWYAFILNNERTGNTLAVVLELNDKTKEHVRTYYKNKFENRY